MRKASLKSSALSDDPWKATTSNPHAPYHSPQFADRTTAGLNQRTNTKADGERIDTGLNIARRVGLPPPFARDLDLTSMWNPVVTMELDAVDQESAITEVEGEEADADLERSASTVGTRPRRGHQWNGSDGTGNVATKVGGRRPADESCSSVITSWRQGKGTSVASTAAADGDGGFTDEDFDQPGLFIPPRPCWTRDGDRGSGV